VGVTHGQQPRRGTLDSVQCPGVGSPTRSKTKQQTTSQSRPVTVDLSSLHAQGEGRRAPAAAQAQPSWSPGAPRRRPRPRPLPTTPAPRRAGAAPGRPAAGRPRAPRPPRPFASGALRPASLVRTPRLLRGGSGVTHSSRTAPAAGVVVPCSRRAQRLGCRRTRLEGRRGADLTLRLHRRVLSAAQTRRCSAAGLSRSAAQTSARPLSNAASSARHASASAGP